METKVNFLTYIPVSNEYIDEHQGQHIHKTVINMLPCLKGRKTHNVVYLLGKHVRMYHSSSSQCCRQSSKINVVLSLLYFRRDPGSMYLSSSSQCGRWSSKVNVVLSFSAGIRPGRRTGSDRSGRCSVRRLLHAGLCRRYERRTTTYLSVNKYVRETCCVVAVTP